MMKQLLLLCHCIMTSSFAKGRNIILIVGRGGVKMENQDHEKRLHLAERLNWDYDVDPALLLAVIDGKMDKVGPFDADRLMVRSLERLSWYAVVALWGMDRLTIFPISTVLPRLRSVELRRRYDYAFRLLRNETLPTAGWSTEMRSQLRHGLFSHRWDRTQPHIS
jgi:hypothetical protein